MQQQGTLLVLREGSYVRTKLRSLRIHDEWGAAKDYGSSFRGEVFIEEGPNGTDLAMFKQALEHAPHKNEKTVGAAMIAAYSVGLITLGMAVHHLMMLHWLR